MTYIFLSYARKSSQGETKQIESIDDQERELKRLEEREVLYVKDWLSEARTAAVPGRPVFRQMLNRIQAGEANAILCWSLNRLSRNELEWGELQWLLRTSVIQLIKTPERVYKPEDHALLIAFESSMASQYPRDLRRDVERGVREKAEKGIYPYKPKLGYCVDPISREVVPDPARFSILRKALELIADGTHSVPQALSHLSAGGFCLPRTRSGGGGGLLSRSSMYRLVRDKFYAGYFSHGGVERLGRHEPLIPLETWNRIQRLLGEPEHGKLEKHYHPFAGLIRCGTCGCLITAETHVKPSGKTYVYYHCTGRRGCRKLSLSEATIADEIRDQLLRTRLDRNFADWALQVLAREGTTQATLTDDAVEAQTRALGVLTRRIDRLYQMREDEEVTREEFLAKKTKYEMQKQEILKAARQKANTLSIERARLKDRIELSRDGYERFTEGDPHKKGHVARSFSSAYVLTHGTLRIPLDPVLDRIRTFELPNSTNHTKGSGGGTTVNPIWRAMWDEIRNAAAEYGKDDAPMDNVGVPQHPKFGF